MTQQRALAAAGRTEQDQGRGRQGLDQLGQALEALRRRQPALAADLGALVQQQGEAHEAGVDAVARLGPFGDPAEPERLDVRRRQLNQPRQLGLAQLQRRALAQQRLAQIVPQLVRLARRGGRIRRRAELHAQRRSAQRDRRAIDLAHALGLGLQQGLGRVDVLEPMRTAVQQAQPGRQQPGQGIGRDLRDEDLPPVGRAGDPGCPVHLEAGVVLVEARDLAGVQAHPDPDRLAVREGMSLQRALGLDGGQQGVQRRVEDVEEGIADGPDLDAAAGAEGAADQPIVLIQHLREARPEPLDQLGRALDVAEEDRHPTLGQVLHPPRRAGPKLTTGSAAAGRASRPR